MDEELPMFSRFRATVSGFAQLREFMLRGDLLALVVGFIIALATFDLIEVVVGALVAPLFAALLGEPSIQFLTFEINNSEFAYGALIEALLAFALTATVVCFLVVVPYARLRRREGVAAQLRPCPECTTSISTAAKRCPQCTAVLAPERA